MQSVLISSIVTQVEQDTALAILCLNLEFSKRKQKHAPFR